MLMVGILSALGLLLLALKAGGRKTIGHDVFVDVLITVKIPTVKTRWKTVDPDWRS